ncbi:MAG: endonuclease/exonuclease/phosphatase family protein [bacterium]|nr:endonuclease/exonuclease/phosphatase family protein [Candidatus Limimorpha equi]
MTACGEKEATVRYISYNIRYGTANDGDNSWEFRQSATKKMLENEQPTVFGLQEALPLQLDYIGDNFPQYSRVGVGRDDGKEAGEFMALFYRNDLYDLLDSGDFWLSETPDTPTMGWDAACYRIVTWAKLKDVKTEKAFYAFNTHLDHVGQVAREQSILLIIKRINEIVEDETLPVFLSGDFNSDVSSPIFDPLKAVMSDSRALLAAEQWEASFNYFGKPYDGNPLIDHIFYKNAEITDFRTLNGDYGKPYISDHYPIMAEFVF